MSKKIRSKKEVVKDEYLCRVENKEQLNEIREYSDITFISQVSNIICIRLKKGFSESDIENTNNILSYEENGIGNL